MPRYVQAVCGGLLLLASVIRPAAANDELPLHDRIDQMVEAAFAGPFAATATDAEFLRRAYLDLVGFIPTATEARVFLDDPSPYKRDRLIDDLLARPEHARRLQYVFDEMWMERRPDAAVPRADWQAFLFNSFAANRPYDQIVRDILAADGTGTPADRAPARFVLDRQAEPNLLTRDIGRIFLGRDMQCAQCHDHLLIEDYKQSHYYGLYAFLSRSSVFNDPVTQKPVLAEKADGDVTFSSVFKRSVTHATGPRVLDHTALEEPTVDAATAYLVAPADRSRSVPVYSRRDRLGPALTSVEVPEFDRNIVNRLWALMMKRGLVHPLDLDHGDNPPSHPELLDLLAREFRASGCDIRAMIRTLARTRTYQRSSEPPPGASEDAQAPEHFAVAALRPLSAEQTAWSVMQASGVLASYRAAEEGRLAADPKLTALLDTDETRRRRRPWLIEQGIYEKLSPSVGVFVTYFSAGEARPPDALDSNVHQALFLSNGPTIQSWLSPSGSNLTGRMNQAADADLAAEELYLSVLSRRPSAEERAEVRDYLNQRGPDQKAAAVQDLAWALLTSVEFRFQH